METSRATPRRRVSYAPGTNVGRALESPPPAPPPALPEWQPDDAVTECPICSSAFTFFNRRHHCRKCGRVVCAPCSPHRVVLPWNTIVHPPSPSGQSSTEPTVRICNDCTMLPAPPPLPNLQESDYCPICHRPLPLLPDPSEWGREAHVAACIAGTRARSYSNTGRMVVWNASKSDTVDSEGGAVECVICFEEFLEGQEVARLECFCRYHKKCIRDWFDHKGNGQCPIHAVHD